ncbi:ATP-binding cassette domain-containing protein [Hoyosella sp. YIM 151337]|uniref:ATP-binding cassette domain-containing protein n=1 Tax=Hoyosella sp. YIM 151337 TaxID=2992742 RepID=UPI00223658B2|nr:ATP-binding cassette domain-containing protein [Hoyosella sp. YIM 151337]MCW4353618.1 ATP-binding cassette domain-containing protein [Hoyosella sp. YIM 151337]
MSAPLAIFARGLTKHYGENAVLNGIDIAIPKGTVFALLGPNGAGKTTTVRILTTLTKPDGGTAVIASADIADDPDGVRRRIGVTGQFSAVDELLTARENLLLMSDLLHLPRRAGKNRAQELLEQFDLLDAADRTSSTFSGGMLRRLDLAMTLMGNPEILFLDEPTTGLDPRSRRAMWDIIRMLVTQGTTVFLTTQYLEEADQLANQIAVLDNGRIVAAGTPSELKRLVPGGHIKLEFSSSSDLEAAAVSFSRAVRDEEALTLSVASDGGVASLRNVLDQLSDAGVEPDGISVHTPDLDDVFLTLTGHTAEKETTR